MASLALRRIDKRFGATDILKSVDLEIQTGEFVVVVGPSGCAKSTILRIIAGLETQTAGRVLIDGAAVDHLPPAARGVAMVFQSYALYPHLTVAANMGLALRQAGMKRQEIDAKIAAVARTLQMEPYLACKPAALSGGQRQRAAIGRAIVRDPKLFLFDEPLSNLDAGLRMSTRVELAKLHRELAATMVYVTHDQTEAMTLADRIVILNAGRIEQIGAPCDLYHRPANAFVAGFLGTPHMNLLYGELAEKYRATTIGVRPEHLTLTRGVGLWRGAVAHIENLGSEALVYLDIARDQRLIVRIPGETDARIGEDFGVLAANERIHRFDAAGAALRRV